MDKKKIDLTAPDANQCFFKLVKVFNTPEKTQNFDVRDHRDDLYPGKSSREVAEDLAVFFNRISDEFEPLEACDSRSRVPDPFLCSLRMKLWHV